MLAEAPRAVRGVKLKKGAKAPAAVPDRIPLDDEEALYIELKALRRRLADERNLPAYLVFSDATLQHMARFRPTTAQHLLGTSGVGPKKLETYGALFLDLLRDFTG